MRFLLFVLALAASGAGAEPTKLAAPADAAKCPQASRHDADEIGRHREERVEPRKLGELPAATGYMAVYRRVNGCEVPLTMVDYHRSPKP